MKVCPRETETMKLNKALRLQYPVLTRILIILPFLLMITGAADAAMRIGDMVPAITLTGVQGASVSIPENLKGKVVILHFWQIGCSSCRLEMPARWSFSTIRPFLSRRAACTRESASSSPLRSPSRARPRRWNSPVSLSFSISTP